MPIFMDRHDGVTMTPEDVAEAHAIDLAIQDKYDVNYHTYFYDPDAGVVFCLVEGPNREAVEAVHREAHDASANTIIEIPDGAALDQLVGALANRRPDGGVIAPATRAILFTDLCGSVAQTQALGDDGHMQVLRSHDRIVRYWLVSHDGREVKHTGDGIMAAFTSVASAVGCAVDIQRSLRDAAVDVSIGISAGEPVTDGNDDLFGAAVQLAARLCGAANTGDILVSVAVRELCIGKPFEFRDNGRLTLKGFPEPTQTYAVTWV
ncbi:MAG: nickel-binding protein [Acidimicrobiia bacterium]